MTYLRERRRGGDIMLKRKHMVLTFLVFCLTATLLVGVTSSAEYDPWVDGNDDGIIDIVDIVNLAIRFGEEGTPINKTALLLDLLDRVEVLETGGFIGAPAYDSGWVLADGWITLYHNLGTDALFVYLLGRNSPSDPIRGVGGGDQTELRLMGLNATHIEAMARYNCKYIRAKIWKILPTS
jgi:hypothetical protein